MRPPSPRQIVGLHSALSSSARALIVFRPIIAVPFTALVAGYLLFVLPYSFAPRVRIVSPSYAFGFNNRVGILALIAVVLAITAVQAWLRKGARVPETAHAAISDYERLSRPLGFLFLAASLAYLLVTVIVYFAVAKSSGYYKLDFEASQFLWRLKLMAIYGLRPYRDFVSEYGPVLVYGPAWFYSAVRPLGITAEGAYYILDYLLNLLGLVALLQLVRSLPIRLRLKLLVFALIAIPAFSPSMGLNGVLIRYLLPFWSLLIVHRATERPRPNGSPRRLAILVAVLSFSNIAVSAEIGIAWIVTVSAYALLVCRSDRVAALHIVASEAVALVVSALIIPAAYFHTLTSVSQGGNNFPIVPAPYIVFYVALILWCVPRLLSGWFSQSTLKTSYASAQGILVLATVPAALCRCDPSHVVLYGFGLFIIAFGMFARFGHRQFLLYTIGYVLIAIGFFEWSNARYYGLSLAKLDVGAHRVLSVLGVASARQENPAPSTAVGPALPPIPSLVGVPSQLFQLASFDVYPALALPYGSYGSERSLQNYLWARKKIAPQRYMGALAIYTEPQLTEALADLGRARYLIVQQNFISLAHPHGDACSRETESFKWSLLVPFAPRCVHESLEPNTEIARFIERRYRPVERIGDYVIFERNAGPQDPG